MALSIFTAVSNDAVVPVRFIHYANLTVGFINFQPVGVARSPDELEKLKAEIIAQLDVTNLVIEEINRRHVKHRTVTDGNRFRARAVRLIRRELAGFNRNERLAQLGVRMTSWAKRWNDQMNTCYGLGARSYKAPTGSQIRDRFTKLEIEEVRV